MSGDEIRYVPSWSNNGGKPKRTKFIRRKRDDNVEDISDELANRIVSPPVFYIKKDEVPFYLPHTGLLRSRTYSSKRKYSTGRIVEPISDKILMPDVDQHEKSDVADLNKIISNMKSRSYDFIYLSPVAKRDNGSPYMFRVVPFCNVDRSYFLTMSCEGVVTHDGGQQSFTPLEKWERDFLLYDRISKIRFFKLFRTCKAFSRWKKIVNWTKQGFAYDQLKKQLFMLDPSLRQAWIDVNSQCLDFDQLSLLDLTKSENFNLDAFINVQVEYLSASIERLQTFQDKVVTLVNTACERAIANVESSKQFGKIKSGLVDVKRKMTYVEQYGRKRLCSKLCRFIYLVSIIMTNLYKTVIRNSLRALCSTFQKYFEYSPLEEVEGSPLASMDKSRNSYDALSPFFHVRLIATSSALTVCPSVEEFIDTISEMIDLWIMKILDMQTILSNPIFRPFTCPVIGGKLYGPIIQSGPSLHFVIESDCEIPFFKKECIVYIEQTFEAANSYIEGLEPLYKFYIDNIGKNPNDIPNETDQAELRRLLETYHSHLAMVQDVADKRAVGLILLHFDEFKKELLPTCSKLLKAVELSIPQLASSKIHKLLKECSEATEYLEQDPKTTVDFVSYLRFIATLSDRLSIIDSDVEYVNDLHNIIKEFKVPCHSEDIDAHNNLMAVLNVLKALCENKQEEKEEIVARLNYQIGKDLAILTEEVVGIHEEVRLDWLVSRKSNPEECTVTLQLLNDRLTICQKRATDLRDYQKQFGLEIERFTELEETLADLKIRQLLWETYESWNRAVKQYRFGAFNELIPDDVNAFVSKTLKNVSHIEKMLHSNEIIGDLKNELTEFKLRIPLMTYLRNPALKSRHWLRIESILNRRFPPGEPFTLDLLETCGVLNCVEELENLAAQATSEAALETLLKQVESSWQNLEFIILNYRDSKDVFILGSVEEISQVLDNSLININAIISSRHVGPIKGRVTNWQRSLDLFSKTLDEWCLCQTNWLYLESIFSTPDIQRQLPIEARLFQNLDRSWKEIMRRTKENPLAMQAATIPGTLESLENCNHLIDQIMKCLEAYLESKRVVFPRFYFLSNEELLEILAQTRNPHAVQPHLGKCFDAIHRLEFAADNAPLDIISMISPEGEKVTLAKIIKARGNIESWLSKVEEIMLLTMKKALKSALVDIDNTPRSSWILKHPTQTILTASQITWAWRVHQIFESSGDRLSLMRDFEKENILQLAEMATLVRGDMPPLGRAAVCCLITLDVHARDIVGQLVAHQVTDSSCFEWLKSLRCYWDSSLEDCVVCMSTSRILYGHEYLGASPRLVITPLTDKCYLCLMGALQMDLGGAPSGPAGTGKTETTKDLAKALAVQCVVFNCSESLDYKVMGRFFAGLAQSGAWCCFDEFNRIDVEVLSVIAQQLLTIRNAKVAKVDRFMFEGREIKIVPRCATFITMNPGYAGRTELPDNLKALFRPISMMIPDYALIAEVILYSEGFVSSKVLAHKMTQMYKLCSEQLSQQNHYDFGMRALKSVLVIAGNLKRSNQDVEEDVVLIRALRDSNVPKFLSEDAVLFEGILRDLFPGVVLPPTCYGVLEKTIRNSLIHLKLQPEQCIVHKVIQFYETMVVRHGVMIVGPTGGGKTTVLNTLKLSLTQLYEDNVQHVDYLPVRTFTINPKAVSIGELYGEVDLATLEWRDGILGVAVRTAVHNEEIGHEWIICDGPVDAVWIENMNTVLDDNKTLCLANSERIRLTSRVRLIFEVQDLEQASPATVSRCGMVYIDPNDLQWMPYVKSWIAYELTISEFTDSLKMYLLSLFDVHGSECIQFISANCHFLIPQANLSKIAMTCSLLQAIFETSEFFVKDCLEQNVRSKICNAFVFAMFWGLVGGANESGMVKLESFLRTSFAEDPNISFPENGSLADFYLNLKTNTFESWSSLKVDFTYDPSVPFYDILVPTVDTIRFSHLMKNLLFVNRGFLLTGETGVGKSAVVKSLLANMLGDEKFVSVSLSFSAQTTSAKTQEMIEMRLEKKKRALLGAPVDKRVVVFIDDVNMPALDTYGSQSPVELLRQCLDYSGFYDREKLFWKDINDMIISAACAPPGGGRNKMSNRFVRHFALLAMPQPSDDVLVSIFQPILQIFLKDFSSSVRAVGDNVIKCSIALYRRVLADFLPTPSKCHYLFNLRDLSKCVQGILQADMNFVRDSDRFLRMFYHECLRSFQDRLNTLEDKVSFYISLKELCNMYFDTPVMDFSEDTIRNNPPFLIFGDVLNSTASSNEGIYEEVLNIDKLKEHLEDSLSDYNLINNKSMKLIFFRDAVEHCCRVARILRSVRGNGLLVGVGGMGKQSITKLASHLTGFRCMQLELSQNYDHLAFRSDLRHIYWSAGVEGVYTTFLISDNQIIKEEFLEDINNILNSGEVPNLFEGEELEKVIQGMRLKIKTGDATNILREQLIHQFLANAKQHLRLIIAMSPVGDSFRRRCRMFPSLVNCCTIDWFMPWPAEALLSVACDSLRDVAADATIKLSEICVKMHESVDFMTTRLLCEKNRHYYCTPSSYLQLLHLFVELLSTKRVEISESRDRFSNGLQKLYETNAVIDTMKAELIAYEPLLLKKSEATTELMKHLAKEQAAADHVRQVVLAEEAVAKVKASETQALADEAQKDLSEAMPAMESAMKALDALNKNDIGELKVFNKPPNLVKVVMEAVCLLLGVKQDWATAKVILGDVNFLKRLRDYDKEHINDNTLKILKAKYIDHPDFVPDKVATQSKVCRSLCMWVRAIDIYAKVYKVIEPKRRALDIAEGELNNIMSVLREKQRRLAEVEAQIAALEAELDAAVNEKNCLEAAMTLAAARLSRSSRLTTALGDEQVRWEEQVQMYTERLHNMIGDIILSAASIAYLGPFTDDYRKELMSAWLTTCQEHGLPASSDFSVSWVLADAYEVRMWCALGLPQDNVSVENAVFVTRAIRCPLMIDPQGQANRWVRALEKSRGLRVLQANDSHLLTVLSAAVRSGDTVLVEDVGETIDSSLEPLLVKQIFNKGGVNMIRLGDSDIEYNKNFRLYLTTKLANPHYLPEVCILVTLVNFTVTISGIEEQLLSDVVRLERYDLETARHDLVTRINNDKQQLKSIEEKILRLLFDATDNILDDEELIDTLNESRETTEVTAARLEEAEATEARISLARDRYRPVAIRGAVLYHVVSHLIEINPMYQNSLSYITKIFCNVLETCEKSSDIDARVKNVIEEVTVAIYVNVSRGLFEEDKLLFSFLICTSIAINAGVISEEYWTYFLHESRKQHEESTSNPYSNISDKAWNSLTHLVKTFPRFSGLENSLEYLKINIGNFSDVIEGKPTELLLKTEWNECLSQFEKLMIVKTLKENMLISAITEFVRCDLGKIFIECPSTDLNQLSLNMSNITPLVFILSPGSDPFSVLMKFAADKGFSNKMCSISLGQGQGPIAEKLISQAAQKGEWVLLQNCHLASSWMPQLENKYTALVENSEKVHPDFRLFLSSMPVASFPAAILQNAIKVTNQPPRGIRANMKRALDNMSSDFFEDCPLKGKWRRMVFSICFFHAYIQERKNFGHLGWNIPYDFNDIDREVALSSLKMFCSDGTILWDALEYITGEITYGGRVTDFWDLRCLKTALRKFFSPAILEADYRFSDAGPYYCPDSSTCFTLSDYRTFVDGFPLSESASVFGMSENANSDYKIRAANYLLSSVLRVQQRESVQGRQNADSVVLQLVDLISKRLCGSIDTLSFNSTNKDEKGRYPPLTVVLKQEIVRLNHLLQVVHSSLRDLQKGIVGEIVMSEQLEETFQAFITNAVPKLWSHAAYPSLKCLPSWVRDLEDRINFMKSWLQHNEKKTFWLSGLFFPQGFLTAVLQSHARKLNVPIDTLHFHFDVLDQIWENEIQAVAPSEDGVLIYGLYLEAGGWNKANKVLVVPLPEQGAIPFPILRVLPMTEAPSLTNKYVCPLYKTGERAGVLSTTGSSTNFILPILLPTQCDPSVWTLMATAMLTQLSD